MSKKIDPKKIKKARKTMRKSFERYPHFRDTYVANIAMFFHDRSIFSDHVKRNREASDLLDLIFGK